MKCSICQDGRDKYICAPCAADPINADWNDGEELTERPQLTVIRPTPWNEQEPWKPSELFRQVVWELMLPKQSRRHIAKKLGCSFSFVQKVAKEVGL